MRVEPYSEKYLEDVKKIVENFFGEAVSAYEDLLDMDSIVNTIKAESESHSSNAFLLIINEKCEGILFGAQFQSIVSGKQVYQEIIWYVNESHRLHGVALLKEAEKILKSRGVSTMIMAVLENSKTEKIKKFYDKLGYKAMETHFVRAL